METSPRLQNSSGPPASVSRCSPSKILVTNCGPSWTRLSSWTAAFFYLVPSKRSAGLSRNNSPAGDPYLLPTDEFLPPQQGFPGRGSWGGTIPRGSQKALTPGYAPSAPPERNTPGLTRPKGAVHRGRESSGLIRNVQTPAWRGHGGPSRQLRGFPTRSDCHPAPG